MLLLIQRLHMCILRMFVTYDDFGLTLAPDVIFDVLEDFTSDSWDAWLHLSTSPMLELRKVDPELVGLGLGTVGNYEIFDELWHQLAPTNFEASIS